MDGLARHPRHPVVKALINSYSAAVSGPNKELVHLYEVRDSLDTFFGSQKTAKQQLGASAEYNALGKLSNDSMVKEGRHRGKSLGKGRPATVAELTVTRDATKKLIERFLEFLDRHEDDASHDKET